MSAQRPPLPLAAAEMAASGEPKAETDNGLWLEWLFPRHLILLVRS
jgi:hypothetical protein